MKRYIKVFFLAACFSLPTMADDSAPAISDDLAAARQELAALRERYQDQHPRVKVQLGLIQKLEHQAAEPSHDSASLTKARAKLARLRQRCEEQARIVEDMESRAGKLETGSAELRAARLDFVRIQERYKDGHPKYQAALQRIHELEKNQTPP